MKVLLIFLTLLSFNSFSQLDTNKTIKGEWTLDSYKETSVMIDKESNFISIKNDSIIRLSINNETITIYRKSLYKIDTFSFKYSIKPSDFKYRNQVKNLTLHIDKKAPKRIKRYYKLKFNEISFSIKELNKSQLIIESYSFDNHFINPLFYQSRKTYSFEKTNLELDSLEKQIIGTWFDCEFSEIEVGDTISFQKDSCLYNGKPTFENQREWEFYRNGKFKNLLTGTVFQSGGDGTYEIRNDKISITHNYSKGRHLQQFSILEPCKNKLNIVVLKK